VGEKSEREQRHVKKGNLSSHFASEDVNSAIQGVVKHNSPDGSLLADDSVALTVQNQTASDGPQRARVEQLDRTDHSGSDAHLSHGTRSAMSHRAAEQCRMVRSAPRPSLASNTESEQAEEAARLDAERALLVSSKDGLFRVRTER